MKEYCEAITEGRMQFVLLPADTAVPVPEHLAATAAGVFDLNFIGEYRWMDTVPVFNLFRTAIGVRDTQDIYKLCRFGGWQELSERLYADEFNLVYLARCAVPTDMLISRVPIPHIEDVKGLKMRSLGVSAKIFDSLGAKTLFLPPEECFTALASGLIDATDVLSVMSYYDQGWYEIAKYWVWPALHNYVAGMAFVANVDFWNSLSPGDQVLIKQTWEYIMFRREEKTRYRERILVSKVVEEHGVTMHYWDENDLKKYGEGLLKAFERYDDDPWWSEAFELLEKYKEEMGYK